MDRDIPCFNPIIFHTTNSKNLQIHKQKLNKIKVFLLSIKNSKSHQGYHQVHDGSLNTLKPHKRQQIE